MSVAASSSSEGEQNGGPNSKTKFESFSNWIHCICVVTFDLELGQAIEVSFSPRAHLYLSRCCYSYLCFVIFQAVYPSHIKLSEQERSNVCYLAFPDSNSGCMGDTRYHVRIRQNAKTFQETRALKNYDRKSPIFLQTDKDYYWGYVYFRQVKDKNLPRGYFQKVTTEC